MYAIRPPPPSPILDNLFNVVFVSGIASHRRPSSYRRAIALFVGILVIFCSISKRTLCETVVSFALLLHSVRFYF